MKIPLIFHPSLNISPAPDADSSQIPDTPHGSRPTLLNSSRPKLLDSSLPEPPKTTPELWAEVDRLRQEELDAEDAADDAKWKVAVEKDAMRIFDQIELL